LYEDTERDWEWANQFFNSISDILKIYFGYNTQIIVAPKELDLEKATDYLLDMDSSHIACRIRKMEYHEKFADITIRSFRSSGATTELEKLANGFGDYYFYGWGDPPYITYFEIINLHKIRPLIKQLFVQVQSGKIKEIPNTDGRTRFVTIKPESLVFYQGRIGYNHTVKPSFS